ncbi:FAD:protein FMN transferase [Simiduia aestuariiviva]|uniref:FAD:protein FMN transferase n=1 Tax=Simiduia aestuariiviva TaxID=1510459 RepID=A0A839UKY7_9GAMM|nr:FAD:protein FMN transferase [Simiduia aestuariiviva]MBB3168502.1 thiamine biosynthesis lipoprotein [Simiduia aestuariiviva]
MGTTYHVTVVGNVVDPEALKAKIDAVLVQVNREMSTYDPHSELMALNGSPIGVEFDLSEALAFLLQESAAIHRDTGGAFDITVGPLVNRWGFGPDADQAPPRPQEVKALMARVGFQHLQFNDDGTRVTRKRDVFVDLSAIAKGYGVDQVALLLAGEGYRDYLVEIGGELRLAGNNPLGKPWRIAVERPQLVPGSMQAAINVTEAAVATSGSYRNFKWVDGKQLSHTIDPATGWPVDHQLVSVTVIAKTCARADALATAFSVMGPEKTLAFAEQHALPVFMLEQQGGELVERWSTSFASYIDD